MPLSSQKLPSSFKKTITKTRLVLGGMTDFVARDCRSLLFLLESCYLLSSPTINNALRGTMSNSPEDYGGLLEILWGDFFGGGKGLKWEIGNRIFFKKR